MPTIKIVQRDVNTVAFEPDVFPEVPSGSPLEVFRFAQVAWDNQTRIRIGLGRLMPRATFLQKIKQKPTAFYLCDAVLNSVNETSRPRLLDLGAGAGRIGRAFVDAGDDYCGVDLSLEMLRQFGREQEREEGGGPRLAQADGERLPFADATFDAVMLIQVLGAARNRKLLLNEARRVLRESGALVIGHTTMPDDGVDERMKQELASLLGRMGTASYHVSLRKEVQTRVEGVGDCEDRVVAATWRAERTPRAFIERQPTGARFSALPEAVKDEALRRLSEWATATFGSLDAVFDEEHAFELRIYRFNESAGG